jgi:putative transposase
MRTVEQEQVASAELGLPPSVQAALGELVNAAKDGLLALSVGVGLGVLSTLMEEEVSEVVGSKGRHDPDRSAVRHGSTGAEVTLGGRRVAVPRPRVRSIDGEEIELATYAHFADRDPLTRVVLDRCSPASAPGALSAHASRSARTWPPGSVRRARARRAARLSAGPASTCGR